MSASVCSQASDSSSVRQILTAKIPIKDPAAEQQQQKLWKKYFNYEVASRLRKTILIGGFPILLILGMARLTSSPYFMTTAASPTPRLEAKHEEQQVSIPPPLNQQHSLRASSSSSMPDGDILASKMSWPSSTANNINDQQQQQVPIVNVTVQEKISNLSRRTRRRLDDAPNHAQASASIVSDDNNNFTKNTAKKPIIYTFYTALHNKKETGMTDEDDELLLQAWKEEWTNHGWEPRVVGLEAAVRHPDYASMNALLLQDHISIYNRYCFLRWLAMATIHDDGDGGGWMSDYDTFPLHPFQAYPLPNQGKLTVHEYSKNGGVPDLLSGSATEYHRMAEVLVEAATAEALTSDMFAMHHIWVAANNNDNDHSIYVRESNVMPAQVILRHTKEDRICKRTLNKYAIHFSHYSMEAMEDTAAKDRATMAQAWLKDWRNKCVTNNVIESNQQQQQQQPVVAVSN